MTDQKRPPGRPKGTTKLDEYKSAKLTLDVSPTAHKWVKAQGRGWLVNWIETEARKEQTGA